MCHCFFIYGFVLRFAFAKYVTWLLFSSAKENSSKKNLYIHFIPFSKSLLNFVVKMKMVCIIYLLKYPRAHSQKAQMEYNKRPWKNAPQHKSNGYSKVNNPLENEWMPHKNTKTHTHKYATKKSTHSHTQKHTQTPHSSYEAWSDGDMQDNVDGTKKEIDRRKRKWHVNRNGFAEANKKPNALYSKSRCHCPSG